MTIKTCRHCDIGFYRDDAAPIPHDRCERCHEELEALEFPLCADGRPCGQQDHPGDDAYCLKCPHEEIEAMKRSAVCACGDIYPANSYGAGFMDGNNGVCENCDICEDSDDEGPQYNPADVALRNKYEREIKPGVWVDVYDVIQAFGVTNGALQHLIKKALAAGQRGHKTREQDLADIVASAKRAQELEQ